MLRIWSFRGSYGTLGNGMQQHSSDVVPLTGLEPVRYRYRRILSDRGKAEADGT